MVKLTAVASEGVKKEKILNMAMLRDCHGVESGPCGSALSIGRMVLELEEGCGSSWGQCDENVGRGRCRYVAVGAEHTTHVHMGMNRGMLAAGCAVARAAEAQA